MMFLRQLACIFAILAGFLFPFAAGAQDDFLDPEKAFALSVATSDKHAIDVHFRIAPGYYMYRERFEFAVAPEAAARFQALAGAGITGAQLEALAPLLAAPAPAAVPAAQPEPQAPPEAARQAAEATSRQQILAALQQSAPAPVHHAGQPRPETPETRRAASAQRMKGIPRR